MLPICLRSIDTGAYCPTPTRRFCLWQGMLPITGPSAFGGRPIPGGPPSAEGLPIPGGPPSAGAFTNSEAPPSVKGLSIPGGSLTPCHLKW